MPERQDESPDDNTAIVRAVEALTGAEPVESGELIGDPELRRKYQEIMEREKLRDSPQEQPHQNN